jgi:hypothetical protein
MGFERVYTVWDCYDGPRSGIAAFAGQPHHYSCEWDAGKDDYGVKFVLTPIDQVTLTLAMEQWAIWLDWDDAFRQGRLPQSTHPGLPGSNPRYAELNRILNERISQSAALRRRAKATFRDDHSGTVR